MVLIGQIDQFEFEQICCGRHLGPWGCGLNISTKVPPPPVLPDRRIYPPVRVRAAAAAANTRLVTITGPAGREGDSAMRDPFVFAQFLLLAKTEHTQTLDV